VQTAQQHSTVFGLTNITVAYDEHKKKKYYTKAEELKTIPEQLTKRSSMQRQKAIAAQVITTTKS